MKHPSIIFFKFHTHNERCQELLQ